MTERQFTMRPFALLILAFTLAAIAPRPAAATFSCTIIGGKDGHVPLYAEPDDDARVIRDIPNDAVVSLIDYPPKPAPKGWLAVMHNEEVDGQWGTGTLGWMHDRHLSDCG